MVRSADEVVYCFLAAVAWGKNVRFKNVRFRAQLLPAGEVATKTKKCTFLCEFSKRTFCFPFGIQIETYVYKSSLEPESKLADCELFQ